MASTTDIQYDNQRVATAQTNTFVKRSLMLLGVVLASGGQIVLFHTSSDDPNERSMQALAGCLFVVGALLFGTLAPSILKLPRLELPRRQVSQALFQWRNRWTLSWLLSALLLAGLAGGLFVTGGESPTVVLIWLISIVALLVAQLRHIRLRLPAIAPSERMYLALLAGLLLVALITRTYNLTTLPYNVDGDYADVGLQARALVIGQQQYIFTFGWASVPMLGYLPPWLTMGVFGTGLAGLNASGVIEGLLIILGIFLLGRDLFNARVGLFAAALMTISYTHLAASRQSSYIDPAVFVLFAAYFLYIGLREGRGWAIVISGILTALCFQMYYSGRIVAFIAAFILLYMLIFRRRWLWARKWTICLWVLAVFITLGPMLIVFLRDTEDFMTRTNQVSIFNPANVAHMDGVFQVTTMPALLLEQARHTALLFNYYVDKSTQFALGQPFLDPFAGVLFILGMGYALTRRHWLSYSSLLAWLILGVVIGCFLTVNPPFWTRLIVLLPPTILLAAVSLNQLYSLLMRGLARLYNPAALFAPITATLLIISVGIQNWNTYVETKGTWATSRTSIARYLADQPAAARAYLISDYYTYHDREFEFLAPDRLVANLTPEQAEGTIAAVGTPTLLILSAEQRPVLDDLQKKIPAGQVETHIGNSPSEVAFYVFQLP